MAENLPSASNFHMCAQGGPSLKIVTYPIISKKTVSSSSFTQNHRLVELKDPKRSSCSTHLADGESKPRENE